MIKNSLGIFFLLSFSLFAKTQGNLRLGIQKHEQNKSSTDIAVGGMLKYESEKFKGINLGVGFYTVNALNKQKNDGMAFYGTNNKNYTLLGEAYVEADLKHTTLILGRQVLDTPFLNSDDTAMVQNLYEAYTVIDTSFKDLMIVGSYVTKMAGVDALMPQQFSKINGNDGVEMIGLIYERITNTTLQSWYYNSIKQEKIIYFEGTYEGEYSKGAYSLHAQYVLQDHKQSKKAAIYGVALEVGHQESGLGFTLAYNKTDSTKEQEADNFYGGGPFFTCSEHLTLAESGSNGDVKYLGISYDMSHIGINDLTLSVSDARLKGDNIKMHEMDFVLNYSLKNDLSIDAIYSNVKDNKDDKNSFKNSRIFVNYHF